MPFYFEGDIRDYIAKMLAQRRNYRDEIINLVAKYPYVIFYGCGEVFRGVLPTWNKYIGRKIDFCCDADESKWGKEILGIKCISLHDMRKIKDQCAIFVTLGQFKPVINLLKSYDFPSVNLVYKYDLEITDFLEHCNLEIMLKSLSITHDVLTDQQSRKVFNAIINRVLNPESDMGIMQKVCESDQYFPHQIINLSEHERFVDIGAFDGDTLKEFVDRTHGKFDQIFAFELDAVNFSALKKQVQLIKEQKKIKIFNVGIWDTACDINYSVEESQSSVGNGGAEGHVVTLDDTLGNEKITFIKMDIEGAELKALNGTQNIIKSQKPNLAICIYHDFRHLWEIPLLLKSLVPEYRIYLRHHTNLEYETVCYAIV